MVLLWLGIVAGPGKAGGLLRCGIGEAGLKGAQKRFPSFQRIDDVLEFDQPVFLLFPADQVTDIQQFFFNGLQVVGVNPLNVSRS
jgi:hypothetical protein